MQYRSHKYKLQYRSHKHELVKHPNLKTSNDSDIDIFTDKYDKMIYSTNLDKVLAHATHLLLSLTIKQRTLFTKSRGA